MQVDDDQEAKKDRDISEETLREITGINKADEKGIDAREHDREELRNIEEGASAGEGEGTDSSEKKEEKSLEDQLGERFKAAREADGDKSNFFRDDEESGGKRNFKTRFLKNRKILAGAGVGVIGLLFVGGSLLGGLSAFKLDHLLSNIQAKTFTKYNATFENRSDKWMRSYIKLRLTQLNGDTKSDDAFFRARGVDTNNPVKDWYRTMRASNFEADLAKKGIVFNTNIAPDGTIKLAKITIDGTAVDFTPKDVRQGKVEDFVRNADNRIDAELFSSNSQARKAIKEAVNNETRFSSVLKRRQLRKSIQNMTGISDWSFFEKTKDKFRNSHCGGEDSCKAFVQKKILRKVLSSDTNTGKFLQCLFAIGDCPRSSDPADPENVANVPTATGAQADNPPTDIQEDGPPDKNGNATVTTKVLDDAGNDITRATEEQISKTLATDSVEAAGESSAVQEITKKITEEYVTKFSGVQSVVSILDKLSTVNDNFNNHKYETMVKDAKRAVLVGTVSTYMIAHSQQKSGDLVGDEMNDFMDTTNGVERSEGWACQVAGSCSKVSDAERKKQCAADAQIPDTGIVAQCPPENANYTGVFGTATDSWNSVIGNSPIGTLLTKYKTARAQSKRILGPITNLVSEITGPLMSKILDVTGVGKLLSSGLGWMVKSVISFTGVLPSWDPAVKNSGAKLGNILLAGSAVMAQSSIRSAGGVASTAETAAYNQKLIAQYQNEQQSNTGTFDQIASLGNPDSVASKGLFALSTSSSTQLLQNINLHSAVTNIFGSLFTSKVHAQSTSDSESIAKWAGADQYDMPQQCLNLDPMDVNYLQKATNAPAEVPRTWELLQDQNAFWTTVYNTEPIKSHPEQAAAIYNCALFDQQVRGGLGFTSGYTKDAGYEGGALGEQQQTNSVAPNTYILGDSLTVGMRDQGDLDAKLQTKGWQTNTISAICGRPLTGTGPYNAGSACGSGLRGLDQIQQAPDQAAIQAAGVIIVGLGTNDFGSSDSAFEAAATQLVNNIKAINPQAKLYWINTYSRDNGRYVAINAILGRLSPSLGFTVIDWASTAPSLLTSDPIHPFGKYSDMAQLVVDDIGQPSTNSLSSGDVNGCPTTPVDESETVLVQGIRVNKCIATNLTAMLSAATTSGLSLNGAGYRNAQQQIDTRKANCGTSNYDIYQKPANECNPPAAIPGNSDHESGTAIDFNCSGTLITSHSNTCFVWLTANANRFHFSNLPSEPWHWSVDGK